MPGKKTSGPEDLLDLTWTFNPEETGKDKSGFNWGPHKLPLQYRFEDITVVVEKSEGSLHYIRSGAAGSAEKNLLADRGKLKLSPVEPVHIPAPISSHLLIDLDYPVVLEPRASKTIYVTFPVELAAAFSYRRAAGERIYRYVFT